MRAMGRPTNPLRTRGPSTATGIPIDQEWIAEIEAAGEFREPDPSNRPDGFMYDVTKQWVHYQEDVNIQFFLDAFRDGPNGRRCTGEAYIRDATGMYVVDADWVRLMRPCLRRPIKGGEVCSTHGGRIPHVKDAAARRLAEAADRVAERLVGLTDIRDEEKVRIRPQDRIMAANSVLDRAGIKGTEHVEVELPGFRRVLDRLFADDSGEEE
jgi:hypothetical protein